MDKTNGVEATEGDCEPCGLLNDVGIEWVFAHGEVKIVNKKDFDENEINASITPVGYDLRIGNTVTSITKGTKRTIDYANPLQIDDCEVVVITTAEDIRLARRVAGTIHSMVSLVNRGMSHISTTVDPGWPFDGAPDGAGRLGIQIENRSGAPFTMKYHDRFCTLVLYRTTKDCRKELVKSVDGLSPRIQDKIMEKAAADRQQKIMDEAEASKLEYRKKKKKARGKRLLKNGLISGVASVGFGVVVGGASFLIWRDGIVAWTAAIGAIAIAGIVVPFVKEAFY